MNANDDFMDEGDKKFLRKHWRTMSIFVVVGAVAVVEAIYVLLWFVSTAQSTGFVPTTLGQWTIGYIVAFILHLIFWELLLVVSWVLVVAGLIFYRWWKTLSDEEKAPRPKRGKREDGDAFGFLVIITWLFVVWFDGRWTLPFQAWTFNDWVYSFLAAVGWDLLIFGIPLLLYFIYWTRKEIFPTPAPTE
jgi:hypothetical protein